MLGKTEIGVDVSIFTPSEELDTFETYKEVDPINETVDITETFALDAATQPADPDLKDEFFTKFFLVVAIIDEDLT